MQAPHLFNKLRFGLGPTMAKPPGLNRVLRNLVAVLALSLSVPACESIESSDEQNVTATSGTFETFTGEDGQTYFALLSKNGARILRSEGYTTESSPPITPKICQKTACSRTTSSKAVIRKSAFSSFLFGRAPYQKTPWPNSDSARPRLGLV
jgi:hypothetical protein